jgi:dienelactone hydrolase
MHFLSETALDGIVERAFELTVQGERVTGVVWTSVGSSGDVPLLLMGHGGSQHKRAPGVAVRARGFVGALGIAVAAIDAPGHGDRTPSARMRESVDTLRQKMARGEAVGADIARENARQAVQAVPEWRATLDALQAAGVAGVAQPVGYWGMSLGGAIGVPLIAAEPRIKAAVIGLIGLAAEQGELARAAARINVPIEFVMQWDDELVPREASFALFAALGAADKSLHANPGGHMVRAPAHEEESWQRFFARHLRAGS